METALENNPLLKQKKASIQGAEDGKKVAKSAFFPSLTGFVNYDRNNCHSDTHATTHTCADTVAAHAYAVSHTYVDACFYRHINSYA